MTNIELADKALKLATEYSTLYVEGTFGSPLNAINRNRFVRNNIFNARPERAALISSASGSVFAFSGIGLIEGLCWGWNGMTNHNYGGAGYAINYLPDIEVDRIPDYFGYVDENVDEVIVGEALYSPGCCGIYIGNGRVVTCDYFGEDGVQITGMEGLNGRIPWTLHARIPGIQYLAD